MKRNYNSNNDDCQNEKNEKKLKVNHEYKNITELEALAEISILCFNFVKRVFRAVYDRNDSNVIPTGIVHYYKKDFDGPDAYELVIDDVLDLNIKGGSHYRSFQWEHTQKDDLEDFSRDLESRLNQHLKNKHLKMSPSTKRFWLQGDFFLWITNNNKHGRFQLQFINKYTISK